MEIQRFMIIEFKTILSPVQVSISIQQKFTGFKTDSELVGVAETNQASGMGLFAKISKRL